MMRLTTALLESCAGESEGEYSSILASNGVRHNNNPKHLVWNFLTFDHLDLFRILDFKLRILWSQNFKSLWLELFGAKAKAILVFPKVTKAGLGVGGQYGDGALIKGGKTVAYYNTAGVSYGLQAGAQTYGYALIFMNDKALEQIDKADGFEVGVGPSVVVMDAGMAKTTTTTTMKDDIYAFIFGQKGLMAGLGIQGNKITKINPK
jgi:Las17-binding protein actin regulator